MKTFLPTPFVNLVECAGNDSSVVIIASILHQFTMFLSYFIQTTRGFPFQTHFSLKLRKCRKSTYVTSIVLTGTKGFLFYLYTDIYILFLSVSTLVTQSISYVRQIFLYNTSSVILFYHSQTGSLETNPGMRQERKFPERDGRRIEWRSVSYIGRDRVSGSPPVLLHGWVSGTGESRVQGKT